MAMDYAALAAELTTDPLARGYAGMSASERLASLRVADRPAPVPPLDVVIEAPFYAAVDALVAHNVITTENGAARIAARQAPPPKISREAELGGFGGTLELHHIQHVAKIISGDVYVEAVEMRQAKVDQAEAALADAQAAKEAVFTDPQSSLSARADADKALLLATEHAEDAAEILMRVKAEATANGR